MTSEVVGADNAVLKLLDARCSTRAWDPTPLTDEEKRAILHAAMRAPTAGNLMLYSILEIEDQALKDRLAVTCDDQPFVARAPWLLLFIADYQKWMDLFGACGCDELPGVPAGRTPGLGDLLLAVDDALIAAQNAVVAAESLGIGSCYIGDVMERGEEHAELLRLPRWTFPAALLCFGRPKVRPHRSERYERHVVHTNAYRRLTSAELAECSAELDALHGVRETRDGVRSCVQDVYARKFTADFSVELNRSVAWWLERWNSGVGAADAE
jgi:FMN reductase (NADPH)/FMN reductase [NAD(P)H]